MIVALERKILKKMVYPGTFCSLSTGVTKRLCLFKAGINGHGFVPHHISCRQKTRTKNTRTIESENPCKQFTTVAKLFSGFHKKTYGTNNKISVIGVDEMGIAIAFALLAQKVTSNLCLIDLDDEVLKGEHIDLELGSLYHSGANIVSGKDPALTAGSKICIILTGTFQGKSEPESTYIGRNIAIIKALLPPIVKYNPETLIVIASEPVDILSYVTWKISGFPKNRVIGLGTLLDTARFRCLLSQKMGISPENCHGYIIGERGENSVPVWSSVNIAGIPLKLICPKLGGEEDNENWQELHKEVVNCDQNVRAHKGYSAWSLALALAHLCETIFSNSNKVLPVSTYAQGEHNIMDEVFLSLPCVIGENGVSDVLRQPLSDKEEGLLRACASNIAGLLEPALKA